MFTLNMYYDNSNYVGNGSRGREGKNGIRCTCNV